MKPKKNYSFTDKNQIWRILISDSDKLILETRDTDKKEVFFHCLNIDNGKELFKKKQFDEKYWIGIETIYKDVVYFHKFAKPDMPGHKEIIAYDINTQKILWKNEQLTFLFIYDDRLYAFEHVFGKKDYYALDFKTGEVIEKLDSPEGKIDELSTKTHNEKDYSNYIFTERYLPGNPAAENCKKVIDDYISNVDIEGFVEYTNLENYLMMNYHKQNSKNNLTNEFVVVEKETGKELFNEILNKDTNAFVPDSFFIYKNFLLLLKEKTKLYVYNLE